MMKLVSKNSKNANIYKQFMNLKINTNNFDSLIAK